MIKKFTLGAKEYTIDYPDYIEGDLGKAESYLNNLKVATKHNGIDIPESSIEQSMYHELVHAILDEIGELDLSKSETFVQSFALLLHQFDKTKRH